MGGFTNRPWTALFARSRRWSESDTPDRQNSHATAFGFANGSHV
jgi:hypothetical protein